MQKETRLNHKATLARFETGELKPRHGNPEWAKSRGSRLPVAALSVHREVWNHALKLAGGDFKRLEIVDSLTVVVWNSEHHKQLKTGKRS